MAKIVNQKHFDDIVKENMEDLDLPEDEAIADAIQQLEAQGVNLSNIIKNPKMVVKITSAVDGLKEAIKNSFSNPNVEKFLEMLPPILDGDISYKLFAASKGLYDSLIKCIQCSNASTNELALKAIIVLMDGYPDLLNSDGVNLQLSLLQPSTTQAIKLLALKWLVVSVRKHEKTRACLIERNIGDLFCELLKGKEVSGEIVSGVCSAMQVLTLDDDVRVEHGNAHEHARTLATQMLPLCTKILSNFVSDASTIKSLLASITSMLVRNEFCIIFYENEGVKYVLDAMVEHPNDVKVVRECFLVIKNLAGSDEVKENIIGSGASPLLVASLEKHYKDIHVAIAGCMCIAALSLRSPNNSRSIVASGGAETLVRCLFHWKQNKSIMSHGCSAMRNQVSRCPELCEEYRNLHVEELLQGNKTFEAKSVLSYLGCHVNLKEEWRGTGVQLPNS